MYNHVHIITSWWLTYPSEKYESQLGLLFPNIPNRWKTKKCSKPPTRLCHNILYNPFPLILHSLHQYPFFSIGSVQKLGALLRHDSV